MNNPQHSTTPITLDYLRQLHLEKSGIKDHVFASRDLDDIVTLTDNSGRPMLQCSNDDGFPVPLLGASLERHGDDYSWRLKSIPSEVLRCALHASNRFRTDPEFSALQDLIGESNNLIEDDRWRIITAVQDVESCSKAIDRLSEILA
jgi:hypothetical protein